MKVLCIGDSNTFGFDPRSPLGERYPDDIRWTGKVSGHEMINWGINGITVPHDHSVYVDLIRRKDPDLVIVMLGCNDLLMGGSAEQTAHYMGEFLDSLRTAGKKILLIAAPPFIYGDAVQTDELIEESKKLAGEYRDLADKKGCLFEDAGEWDVDIAFDGVHFSEEGHAAFARGLEKALERLEA